MNWQSFIFREDVHQEAFTVGISSRVKYNDPASRFHFYTPVQGLVQHRGGEIDTIFNNSVQTLMNGAIGVGGVWNTGHRIFKNLNVELDATGYYQVMRDTSAEFFIDKLKKGTVQIEYKVYIDRSGAYQTGIATVQSAYAPEFAGYGKSLSVTVR